MKVTKFYLAAVVTAVVFLMNIFTVYAHDYATPYSWYLKFEKPNTPPQSIDLSGFSEDYGLIYKEDTEKTGSKNVYLTFDVGYDDGNVAPILDALKKHNVKGAFFVLPHFIEGSPALLSRMIDEGHLICNHTTHHKDMSKVSSAEEFISEMRGIEQLYKQKTGLEMAKFFRPPEGKFSENMLKYANEAGYKTVFWSLAYADWDKNNQPDPQKALGILLSRIHDGSIVLLHPTSSTNAAIMDSFLNELRLRGYTFARLDEFPDADNSSASFPDQIGTTLADKDNPFTDTSEDSSSDSNDNQEIESSEDGVSQ